MAFLAGRMIWEFGYRRSKMEKIYRRIRTVYTIANTGSLDSLRLALSLFCLSLKYPCLFIKYLEVERAYKMAFAASVINLGYTARLR